MKKISYLILGMFITFLLANVSYVTKGVYITSPTGNTIGTTGDNLNVILADQTTPAIAIKFGKTVGSFTTLTNAVEVDDTTAVVGNVTGVNVGDRIGIFGGGTRFFFAKILSIDTNTITFDSPVDYPFDAGSGVAFATTDIATANGSLASPIYFEIKNNSQVGSGAILDITRLLFLAKCSTAPEFNEFCDITNGLTNGIVLRKKVNGVSNNYWNIKKNSDFALLAYDLSLYDSSPPLNINGISSRITYAGSEKHGVVIRIEPQQSLQLIIQDNLTSLISFEVMAEGHYTTDIF